jgi:hypothetical protein
MSFRNPFCELAQGRTGNFRLGLNANRTQSQHSTAGTGLSLVDSLQMGAKHCQRGWPRTGHVNIRGDCARQSIETAMVRRTALRL